MSRRKSNGKSIGERHDRAKWWLLKVNDEIFVEKNGGRAKTDGNELPPLLSIAPSSSKPELLKVLKFSTCYIKPVTSVTLYLIQTKDLRTNFISASYEKYVGKVSTGHR